MRRRFRGEAALIKDELFALHHRLCGKSVCFGRWGGHAVEQIKYLTDNHVSRAATEMKPTTVIQSSPGSLTASLPAGDV